MKRELRKVVRQPPLWVGPWSDRPTMAEQLKAMRPDITWQEAKDMVAKYWEGVPVFFDYCKKKQYIAKNEMLCKK